MHSRGRRFRTDWRLAVVLVLIAAAGMAACTEHIGIGGGFGWDGQFYGRFAQDPGGALRTGVDAYRIQRVVPALVVHASFRLAHIGVHDVRAIIAGFQLLNCVCLVLTAVVWLRVARVLGLSTAAFWLGVIGLFANYAFLKLTAYYPVLNDAPALLLGMVAVWAFIEERSLALALVGLVGALTWPVAAPFVALLLLFPIRPLPDSETAGRNGIPFGVAAASAAAFLLFFIRFYYIQGVSVAGIGPVIPVYPPLAPIGVACTTGYIALVVYVLLRPFSFRVIRAELSRLSGTRFGGAAIVLVGPVLAVRTFTRGDALLTTAQFGKMLVLLSSARPLVSPISHVTYFGPVLVLLIPLGRSYVRVVHSWGTGATLATLAAAIVALSPESRQSIFALPLVITPLCVAVHQARVRDRFVALTAAVAILMSQIWIPINTSAPTVMVDPGANMRAVYARYFMNQGPYMDNAEYAVHVLAVAIVALVLVLVWDRGAAADAVASTTAM